MCLDMYRKSEGGMPTEKVEEIAKTLRLADESLRILIDGCDEIRAYRAHLRHCEVDQTDFCTCGRKQAADAAWIAIQKAKVARKAIAEQLERLSEEGE